MLHAFAKQLIKRPDFNGYREFLLALLRELRALKRAYSYDQFASDLGISSGSLLNQILNGHRHLNNTQLEEIIVRLRFTSTAAKYFTALVKAEQIGSGNTEQKGRVFDALIEAKAALDPESVSLGQYAYARDWYHPVVRELACDPELNGDPELIASRCRPAIKAHQARQSLEMLENEGYIARVNGAAHYAYGQASTTSGSDIHWLISERYHQTSLDLAKAAIVDLNEAKRSVTASTLKLTKEGFDQLCAKVLELHELAQKIEAGEMDYDAVFQFTVQLFPVTNDKTKQNIATKNKTAIQNKTAIKKNKRGS